MKDRSRNIDRRRVLYEPIDVVGEGGETLDKGVKSLHNLCGIYREMLVDVVWRQSQLYSCWKVGVCWWRSVRLVDVSNVDLIL